MNLKPSKRFFYAALGVLAAVLVGFTLARELRGPFLPPKIDENLYNGVIVAVLGLFLWNRQIRNQEAKEAALEEERKAEAEKTAAADGSEAAAAGASANEPADGPGGDAGA
jgi:hypothetical protein